MGAIRPYHFAHEFQQFFSNVFVISTANAHLLEQEALPISKDISVEYVETKDYRTVASQRNTNSHFKESQKSGFLGKTMVKLLNSFPFNLKIGEGGSRYIDRATELASQWIAEHDIQYVFSTFRPYADHEIARRLKGRYPHLIWIADFRDIHIDSYKQNVFFETYQRKRNRQMLATADLVTTVSNGCLDHLKDYGKRHLVLHNGLPKVDTEKPIVHWEQFRICYTGSLYGDMRNPEMVLAGIRCLIDEGKVDSNKVVLDYAGKDGDTFAKYVDQFDLQRQFHNHGMLPYAKSLALQQSSHMNLLLSFSDPNVQGALTGKLYEYLAARKPLLCHINGPKDLEIESFIDQYSRGITTYHHSDQIPRIADFILHAYTQFLEQNSAYFHHNISLAELSWPNLTQKLIKEIELLEK